MKVKKNLGNFIASDIDARFEKYPMNRRSKGVNHDIKVVPFGLLRSYRENDNSTSKCDTEDMASFSNMRVSFLSFYNNIPIYSSLRRVTKERWSRFICTVDGARFHVEFSVFAAKDMPRWEQFTASKRSQREKFILFFSLVIKG